MLHWAHSGVTLRRADRVILRIVGLLLCVFVSGCAQGMHEFVMALNEAKVSNCVFIQGAVPPYGTAYIYAKAGELDCVALWHERNRAVVP